MKKEPAIAKAQALSKRNGKEHLVIWNPEEAHYTVCNIENFDTFYAGYEAVYSTEQ